MRPSGIRVAVRDDPLAKTYLLPEKVTTRAWKNYFQVDLLVIRFFKLRDLKSTI
jgi:hypothetical protein